jgi:hypothetical protein
MKKLQSTWSQDPEKENSAIFVVCTRGFIDEYAPNSEKY